MTEQELLLTIENCRKKAPRAQRALYLHFYNYAMTICYRYTQNKEEAEEVLNDSFFKVFNKLEKYEAQGAFKYWLKRIVVNTCIDHFRKHKNAPMVIELTPLDHPNVDSEVVGSLQATELLKLVQQLPNSYRIAFNLHAVEGYTHPEIASMLGISEGTSKSNLAKARKRLQSLISKNYAYRKHG